MALIIPSIELSAPSATDATKTVKTQLTAADTAYFVNGEFAGQTIAGAAAANPTAAPAAESSAAAFVLPGVTFGIFPIGFIVTGSWAVLFIGTVGMGTLGRQRYRDSYRGQIKRAATASVPRL